ncbi:hypothetical protein EIP86_006980 [Pleurotus ostreatoroseus]|nr:hypothetical protein EIP86_006980 [Pleurotus ostreatoroseus]
MEEPLFDPSLKKRKKKQVAFSEDPLGADADPTTPAPAVIDDVATNGDTVDMGPKTVHEQMAQNGRTGEPGADDAKVDDEFKAMFGDVKKKKKKKDIPLDLPEEASGASTPAPEGEDLDFSDLKKKKKKSAKKVAFDMEEFEKQLTQSKGKDDEDKGDEEDGDGDMRYDDHELGDENPFASSEGVTLEGGNEAWLGSDRDYTYPELLHRFYAQLHASNPQLLQSAGKRFTIATPQVVREGKKSIFANIAEICRRMHRQPEHVIQYMFAEMGTSGSVDGSGRLVIKGRFQGKQIEHVLRRYIMEYVTCSTCKSLDTLLTKENRIFFMACESCGSRRSVAAIKTGFQAQVGKRSKTKTG